MTNPTSGNEGEGAKLALIDAVISMYHTTRLRETPAAEHILGKHCVQRCFDVLLAPTPAPVPQDLLAGATGGAVAWRTEYRDIYKGKDTGWHFKYYDTEPHPAPLDAFGCGHRNVMPLFAESPDLAAENARLEHHAQTMEYQVGEWEKCRANLVAKDAELAAMREAVEILRKEAFMLLQNSEGCAANHYGGDHLIFGMPQWLADSRSCMDAALALARAKAVSK